MNMKHRLARIKKGFTLLELTVVIATTSILLLGFTAFTIFFSNQYDYEMTIDKNENSAVTLKYAISNNIDRYNYNFEKEFDFITGSGSNQVGLEKIFTAVLPIYGDEGDTLITSASVKEYFFKTNVEEDYSMFGYNEYIYSFSNMFVLENERPIDLIRDELKLHPQVVEATEYVIYKTKSRMDLSIDKVNYEKKSKGNFEKYEFTINYDFEKDDAYTGKKQLIFNKYVYFVE